MFPWENLRIFAKRFHPSWSVSHIKEEEKEAANEQRPSPSFSPAKNRGSFSLLYYGRRVSDSTLLLLLPHQKALFTLFIAPVPPQEGIQSQGCYIAFKLFQETGKPGEFRDINSDLASNNLPDVGFIFSERKNTFSHMKWEFSANFAGRKETGTKGRHKRMGGEESFTH